MSTCHVTQSTQLPLRRVNLVVATLGCRSKVASLNVYTSFLCYTLQTNTTQKIGYDWLASEAVGVAKNVYIDTHEALCNAPMV